MVKGYSMRLKFISLCLVGLMGVSYAESAKSVDYFVKNDKEREKTIAECKNVDAMLDKMNPEKAIAYVKAHPNYQSNCENAQIATAQKVELTKKRAFFADLDKQLTLGQPFSEKDKEMIKNSVRGFNSSSRSYAIELNKRIAPCYAKMSENLAKNGDDGLKNDKRCALLVSLADYVYGNYYNGKNIDLENYKYKIKEQQREIKSIKQDIKDQEEILKHSYDPKNDKLALQDLKNDLKTEIEKDKELSYYESFKKDATLRKTTLSVCYKQIADNLLASGVMLKDDNLKCKSAYLVSQEK